MLTDLVPFVTAQIFLEHFHKSGCKTAAVILSEAAFAIAFIIIAAVIFAVAVVPRISSEGIAACSHTAAPA